MAATAAAALQRLADVLFFIEPSSGFYGGGFFVLRAAVAAFAAAACVYIRARFDAPGLSAGEYKKLPLSGVLFALACFFTAPLSVMQGLAKIPFASSRPVAVVLALCALSGLGAAWWFYTAAISCFTKKKEGGSLLSAAVVLWYCLRALERFVLAPVNANDSVTISLMFSALALAAAYLALARRKPQAPTAVAFAFIVCIGFALPCAAWYFRDGDMFTAAQLIGDAAGALAMFLAVSRFTQRRKTEE